MVLRGQLRGRVGRRRIKSEKAGSGSTRAGLFHFSFPQYLRYYLVLYTTFKIVAMPSPRFFSDLLK
jgi:hypothetical protein